MVFGIVGCADNSKDKLEPYLFSTSEKTYIIEEQCFLKNAQLCKTENCNDFVQEFCLSLGEPFSSEPYPKDVFSEIIFDINITGDFTKKEDFSGTLRDLNRAKKIIDDSYINEQYKDIFECQFNESQKCNTNKCNNFVSDYCKKFKFFKGEKLTFDNLQLEKYQQELEERYFRVNLILASPDSYQATEVAESFCYGANQPNREVKVSCEEWFLMDDFQRVENKLPSEKEYRWEVNPSNPESIPSSEDYNIGFNLYYEFKELL